MAREINTSDNMREMVLKNIPSESIAGIVAANGAIMSMTEAGATQTVLLWITFVICLAATPLWLYFGMNVKKTLQLVVASVAFVIWAMTMEGAFTTIPGYSIAIGTVILTLYTIVVSPLLGLIIKKA